jgi:UDP-GlcNAc:undecaprenyl-phosphate/decaprenyl-phosphate GlcNAc-1-phosphate transferase
MNNFGLAAFASVAASFAVAAAVTLLIIRLASRLPGMVRSSADRLHVAPTPVWGGVAIFCSFMGVAWNRGLLSGDGGLVLSACGIFFLGLTDDIWKMRPRWKLFFEVVCALTPISFVIHHPLTGIAPLDLAIAALWIVGITNAFNLLDNINGLSAGTALLVGVLQVPFFLEHVNRERALESLAFCGAVLGFLVFNFPKGRIFMGDSGSLFIGFWLASRTLSVTQASGKEALSPLLFSLLVMIVPICDTTLVTLTRLLKGSPVSVGGTDHLSHRLVAYGFTQKNAVLALWTCTLVSGVLGLLAVSYHLPTVVSSIPVLVAVVALLGTYLTRFELRVEAGSAQAVRAPRAAGWVRLASRVLLDMVLIAAAYYVAYLIRFDGEASGADLKLFASTLGEIILIKLVVFVAFRAYRPWWDYFGLKDAYRLVGMSVLASLTIVAYLSAVYRFYGFSRIVIAIDFLLFTMLALVFRFSFRLLNEIAPGNHRTNVFIYGANGEGETALQFVSKHYNYRVVGFLDDDAGKRHFSIRSVPIRGGTADLPWLCSQWQARTVLVAPSTPREAREKLLALCQKLGVDVLGLRVVLEDLNRIEAPDAPEMALAGNNRSGMPASVTEPRTFSKANSA